MLAGRRAESVAAHVKYLPSPHEKAPPRLREFRACMSALEEALTMPIFELLNLRTQRRLGDVKLIRSPSKTQLLCNSNECDEVTEIWALVHNALTWLLYLAGRALRVDASE